MFLALPIALAMVDPIVLNWPLMPCPADDKLEAKEPVESVVPFMAESVDFFENHEAGLCMLAQPEWRLTADKAKMSK